MAIMAIMPKDSSGKTEAETETEGKMAVVENSMEKFRPITATLKHPLILDVKLLRKLDMTTFTKNGLMALSKFCGISLVTRQKSKRKSKKETAERFRRLRKDREGEEGEGGEEGKKSISGLVSSSDSSKSKRKPAKGKILRFKRRIKLLDGKKKKEKKDGDGDDGKDDEDSSDVICKKHNDEMTKGFTSDSIVEKDTGFAREMGSSLKKIDLIGQGSSNLEVVPEPCKSCTRRHQPERLHSHPKSSVKTMDFDRRRKTMENGGKSAEERSKYFLWTKDMAENSPGNPKKIAEERNPGTKKNPSSAKDIESSQKLHLSDGEMNRKSSSVKTIKGRGKSDSQLQLFCKKSSVSSRSPAIVSPATRSPAIVSPATRSPATVSPAIGSSSKSAIEKITEKKKSPSPSSAEDDRMKYITGCYVCGRQITSKARTDHEKECILEWRRKNDLLDPKNRKSEPARPDYRFKASGDLDFEATFESIWANHVDSLVPCRKCGRKFFPDRIERHENCCKNSVSRIKRNN